MLFYFLLETCILLLRRHLSLGRGLSQPCIPLQSKIYFGWL